MPDVITHALGAVEAISRIDDPLASIVQKNKNIYRLGAQGPDFFFYYHVLPGQDSNGAGEYGGRLHREHSFDFLMSLLDYAKIKKKSKDYPVLASYSLGFLTHYAFDLTMHPFIFAHSGVVKADEPDTKVYHYYHKMYEIAGDTFLLYEKKKQIAGRFRASQWIDLRSDFPRAIPKMLAACIDSVHGIKWSYDDYQEALESMPRTLDILHDPLRIKQYGFYALEFILRRRLAYTQALYLHKVPDNPSFFNLDHQPWFHPARKDIIYTDSYLDRYEQGVDRAESFLRVAIGYLEGSLNREDLLAEIGDMAYDTGLPWTEDQTMEFTRCVFETL
jgi:hypothetical protein